MLGYEYNVMNNSMILEDSIYGVIDIEKEVTYLDVEKAEVTYFLNNEHMTKVFSSNFILSERSTKYYRIAYTFMDALGEIGGLKEMASLIIAFLLFPVNYNIQGIQMLKQYILEGDHQQMTDFKLSLKSLS